MRAKKIEKKRDISYIYSYIIWLYLYKVNKFQIVRFVVYAPYASLCNERYSPENECEISKTKYIYI